MTNRKAYYRAQLRKTRDKNVHKHRDKQHYAKVADRAVTALFRSVIAHLRWSEEQSKKVRAVLDEPFEPK